MTLLFCSRYCSFEATSCPTLDYLIPPSIFSSSSVGPHPRNAYQIMLCDKLPIFRNCMEIYGIIWVLIPESALGSLPKSLRTQDLASELFCLIIIWSGHSREECVHFFTPCAICSQRDARTLTRLVRNEMVLLYYWS